MAKGFLKRYKGCSIIETATCFVATNEYGTTLGQSNSVVGAECIIELYLDQKRKGGN